jgi:hypothetical protein
MFMDSLESVLKRRLSNLHRRLLLLHVSKASHILERRLGQAQHRHRVSAGINKAIKYAVLFEDCQENGEENRVDGKDDHRLALRGQGHEDTGR